MVLVFIAIFAAIGTTTACGSMPLAATSPFSPPKRASITVAGAIQPRFFGMTTQSIIDQADGFYNWPNAPFSGCRLWLAHGTDVYDVQGQYSWEGLDRAVDFCVSQGKEVMYTFGNVPNWMNGASRSCGTPFCESGKPPLDDQVWFHYVTSLVQRYKGRIKYYELWNEPNVYPFGWKGTVPQLMTLVRGEYSIIKNYDPDAITISPSVGSDNGDISYFVSLLKNGAATNADLIGFHGYITKQYQATTATRPPEAITHDLNFMISAMQANGAASKQLIDTESSWNMCMDKTTGFCGNEDLQAAFIAVRYILYASYDLHSYWWYEWDGDTEGDTGWGSLWHRNGSDEASPRETKAAKAYRIVNDWLVGATVTNPGCTLSSEGTWSCPIARPGGYNGQFVWNANGSGTFAVPSGMTQKRDLDGRTETVKPGSSIRLSNKPILLESRI